MLFCKTALWPLNLSFLLKSVSCSWEAVKAARYFLREAKYGFKEAFIFPIYVLLLDPTFQKPFFPKKNGDDQTSIFFNTGSRQRMNIHERHVFFQVILSKTEAFLKWFTAIIVCLASCSCFQQFISWARLLACCVCLRWWGKLEGHQKERGL